MSGAFSGGAAPDPLARLLASDLRLPPDDARAFEEALRGVLTRHPEVRGAAVYAVAHGEAMVRIMTSQGWMPVLLRAQERADARTIERRLESAFDSDRTLIA